MWKIKLPNGHHIEFERYADMEEYLFRTSQAYLLKEAIYLDERQQFKDIPYWDR